MITLYHLYIMRIVWIVRIKIGVIVSLYFNVWIVIVVKVLVSKIDPYLDLTVFQRIFCLINKVSEEGYRHEEVSFSGYHQFHSPDKGKHSKRVKDDRKKSAKKCLMITDTTELHVAAHRLSKIVPHQPKFSDVPHRLSDGLLVVR